jgi:hypothetical protein
MGRGGMERNGAIPAAVTAIVGFGAMNVFWALEGPRTPHRGLYSYLASSLGDALCIPAVVGGISAARISLPKASGGKRAGVVGALLSAGATVATQAAWLSDPNPDLNWTLPAPHTFNTAGWYHAAFSVCLAGYLGYQLGDMILRLRSHGLSRRTRKALLTATVAGSVFSVLLIVDNLPNLDRAASRASMVLLGGTGAGMGALLWWIARQRPTY